METKEVKRKLIARIEATTNRAILEEVDRLLSMDSDESDPVILSDEQIHAVAEGREDYRAGRVKSNDDLNREIEEWLRK